MTWQTNMNVFADFPQRCKWFWDMLDHTDKVMINDETGEWECAFFCKRFMQHRIIEEECLGEECPCCELVGFDEYMKHMKECGIGSGRSK